MDRATPQTRELSQCLIAFEKEGDAPAGARAPVAFRVLEKLRPHLATYMGSVGFQALLSRSLTLAGADVPWLRTVRVKPDGSPEGLDKLEARVDPQEIVEGSVVLVAQLLALLIAFIGEDLTLRMVREVWLKLPPDGSESTP